MTHVLKMTTVKFSTPMTFVVSFKSADVPFHLVNALSSLRKCSDVTLVATKK